MRVLGSHSKVFNGLTGQKSFERFKTHEQKVKTKGRSHRAGTPSGTQQLHSAESGRAINKQKRVNTWHPGGLVEAVQRCGVKRSGKVNVTVNSELAAFIIKLSDGKRCKEVVVKDGDIAPTWHYSPGRTVWRNGKPRRYFRADNWVEVGLGWLVQAFPVAVGLARLTDSGEITVQQDEIARYQERMRLKMEHESAMQRNIAAWNKILWSRERTFEPESEVLFA